MIGMREITEAREQSSPAWAEAASVDADAVIDVAIIAARDMVEKHATDCSLLALISGAWGDGFAAGVAAARVELGA